ncbi:MAG: DUF465 domain-containing protein [Thermodesulfobacteriota bacterium]|nr:DUF465 domain-containing protein [Thermodesulfobacteriota bacterium]
MEQRDLELIARHSEQDAEVRALWEEHILYEKQLEKLKKKSYLTPSEDKAVKDIKKKKLAGKTKLMGVLEKYKSMEA